MTNKEVDDLAVEAVERLEPFLYRLVYNQERHFQQNDKDINTILRAVELVSVGRAVDLAERNGIKFTPKKGI